MQKLEQKELQKENYIIGIDVGGTNTDGVLITANSHLIVNTIKTPTTKDICTGISKALEGLFSFGNYLDRIYAIVIGTTTFLNAILEESEELTKVHVIRLCGTSSREYPPFTDFPSSLEKKIRGEIFMVKGGYQFDRKEISAIDEGEIIEIGRSLAEMNSSFLNIAISGVFSILDQSQEKQCADILASVLEKAKKNYSITLSSTFGTLGLLEREAASILNACLRPLAEKTITSFAKSLEIYKIPRQKLFISTNDGTLTTNEYAKNYPIYTFNSGPTNSLRGALLLTKDSFIKNISNAFVADIGGTSTDITVLKNGYPRPSSAYVRIAGVRTSFQMPDTYCIALGGGSLVTYGENDEVKIGPKSVGYNLKKESKIFGGSSLTTTDIAVAAGQSSLGYIKECKDLGLDERKVQLALEEIQKKLENAVDHMKTSQEPIPLILVGGGSILISQDIRLEGISEIIRPQHFDVANALGAAFAQISASLESVIYMGQEDREKAYNRLKSDLMKKILKNGAIESTVKFTHEEIPLAYVPGQAVRVYMKAIGDLDFLKLKEAVFEEPHDYYINFGNSILKETLKKNEEIYIKPVKELETLPVLPCDKHYITNQGRKEWILTEIDIDYICCGAGIMGCGGGGSPYLGSLLLKKALRHGKKMRVINFEDMRPEELISWVAYFGAPLVQIEKLPGGNEIKSALEEMTKYLSSQNKKISALVSVEIGGLNSIVPLLLGSELDLPVLDGDFMGRAFPELQMCTPFIYGVKKPFPISIADGAGNNFMLSSENVKDGSPKTAEDFLRNFVMNIGLYAGLSSDDFNRSQLEKILVKNSLTKAWEIGKTVFSARNSKSDFIESLVKTNIANKVFEGKIVDVSRNLVKGFTKGQVTIGGSNEFLKKTMVIDFQNENLRARECDEDKKWCDKAIVPHLLAVLDVENYEAIMTEDYKYGLRVVCISLLCDPLLLTPEGLKFCGPKAFGYE